MSRTYSIGCRQCRTHLWIAQESSGDSVLYTAHQWTMHELKTFLFLHRGHPLVFDDNTGSEVAGWEEIERSQAPITLTGADERTDVAALAKLDAEIGLLYTCQPQGRHRYPRWDWIREASLVLRRASLHVCGMEARRELVQGRLPVGGFQRIQVNGTLDVSEVQLLCEIYPRTTIITQHTARNWRLMDMPIRNHALLIDDSGGRGLTPDEWKALDTYKPVGFAGGLGPDNLAAALEEIRMIARPGWWVDMESKLRDRDDWFSLELAEQCCAAFREAMGATTTLGNHG